MILRANFDRAYSPDVELYEKLKRLAETKKMKPDEYCKWVLTEHVRNQEHIPEEEPKN